MANREDKVEAWGQFNKTFTLVIYKLQAQMEMSLIKIVTSPGYKCSTCNYTCSATRIKDGKNQIY